MRYSQFINRQLPDEVQISYNPIEPQNTLPEWLCDRLEEVAIGTGMFLLLFSGLVAYGTSRALDRGLSPVQIEESARAERKELKERDVISSAFLGGLGYVAGTTREIVYKAKGLSR